MLGISALVAFVPTTDLTRARLSYAETLGLTPVAEDPYACTFDAHGTHVRVILVDAIAHAPSTVLG
jgi:hypothetical protein